ncbi:MAG: hypothetical protein RLZZ297_1814 [Chloroflexota bacterium]|jgi:cytochrome c oxidase subunit 2
MRTPVAPWKIAAAIVIGLSITVTAALLSIWFIRTPLQPGVIDPLRLNSTEFRDRGLFQTGPTDYTLRIVAKEWVFDAGQRRDEPVRVVIPVGSTLTIVATSMDTTHALGIDADTTLVITAGRITRHTQTYSTPGSYPFVCTTYCGPGHPQMTGTIVVTP